MAKLIEDINIASDWVIKAFGVDGLKLDHSVESFKAIDKFFDLHAENGEARPGGRLSENQGAILFSIGSYVGNTIIKNVPEATWRTNDEDPQGEVNVEVILPDGTTIYPVQRTIKRFKNGDEDSIYAYGVIVVRDIARGDYWERSKEGGSGFAPALPKKPWWKFW